MAQRSTRTRRRMAGASCGAGLGAGEVSIRTLVSECVDLAQRAGDQIRAVSNKDRARHGSGWVEFCVAFFVLFSLCLSLSLSLSLSVILDVSGQMSTTRRFGFAADFTREAFFLGKLFCFEVAELAKSPNACLGVLGPPKERAPSTFFQRGASGNRGRGAVSGASGQRLVAWLAVLLFGVHFLFRVGGIVTSPK